MIEAVDHATGFCTMPLAEIAERACCSVKTVKAARKALNEAGLWIASGGVFVPCPVGDLNRKQRAEKTKQKRATGTTRVPSLYPLVPSAPLSKPFSLFALAKKPFQPDMFGAPVVDLATYRRGHLPSDLAAAVRAEMRARGITQDELAAELGISHPQLANALAGRFGLSLDPAARLLAWLRKAA
jgi:DNA-binding CsgD family transcriptional regulator